jgi:hypothetical protein
MHVETRRIAVDVSPWIGMGTVGHFVPDRVWITDGERRVIDQRSDTRASFAGHTRETPWDQLHRLYFTSYAVWNYLNTPFLFTLPGFEVKEIEPHQENGESWRCLWVKFPPDVPCPFRKFHPAQIRIVRQNHRIILIDVCDPARARNICRRHVQVAVPSSG